MKIKFTKVEGTGNDFILLDRINNNIQRLKRGQIKNLCSRNKGIGADGILFLEKDRTYAFMMRYFNSDGSETEMCGNGARCIALYAFTNGIVSSRFSFRTKSGVHSAEIFKNNRVKVELPPCKFLEDIKLTIQGKSHKCEFLKIGVPHIVIFLKTVENINVQQLGRRIAHQSRFNPQGTNVNFACIKGQKTLNVRTYERGVESETLSCGTGVAASAASAYRKEIISLPVYIKTKSGETITVLLKNKKENLIPYIIARAHIVFSGTVEV
jgi:diaminopimelate epimerase